jgi:hypothetical protein
LPEVSRPLLQGIQQFSGSPGVDAFVGQGGHDFVEPELHFRQSLRQGGTGPEGIILAEDAFGVLKALMIAVVVEAEFLNAKGGRTAENSILFEMVAIVWMPEAVAEVKHARAWCDNVRPAR